MVNKPASLYRVDAQIALEKERRRLQRDIHGRPPRDSSDEAADSEEHHHDRTITRIPHPSLPSPSRVPSGPGAGVLQGRSMASGSPELIYSHLDSGFIYECYTSTFEPGSYISHDLFLQITPRPRIIPARHGQRLRFNGDYYHTLGSVSFAMKMTTPTWTSDDPKQVVVMVTAQVVPELYPDMFLGRHHSFDLRQSLRLA